MILSLCSGPAHSPARIIRAPRDALGTGLGGDCSMLRGDPWAVPAERNRGIAQVSRDRYLGASQPRLAGKTWLPERRGAVAQMGERCNRTAEVRGSIPLSSTSLRS